MHPRLRLGHFPLWLLAPRCQRAESRTAQIPGNEPFAFRTSWGEEVSSPRVGLSACWRSLPSPSLLYVLQVYVCLVSSFRFRELISRQLRRSSFSHGHHSGNARGGDQCLTRPPVRAQFRREEKRRRLAPRKIKFWCMKLRVPFCQLA